MKAISHTTWSNALFFASLMLVFGFALVLLGISTEAQGRVDLLRHSGIKAVQFYESRTQIASFTDYMILSLRFENPTFGGNEQGIGLAIGTLFLPLVIALGVARQVSIRAQSALRW